MSIPEIKIKKCIGLDALYSIFEAYYPPDFSFSGESHNFWEAVYVIDGEIGASANGKVYMLSKNQIIFHKPMEFHRLWSHGGTKPRLLIFSFSAHGELIKELEHGVFHLNPLQKSEIMNLISYLRNTFPSYNSENTQNFFNHGLIDGSLSAQKHLQQVGNYLELFLLAMADKNNTRLVTRSDRHASNYRQALKIMGELVCENPSVSEIAEKCAVSESYLKSVFLKFAGIGIHKYFLRLKLDYAAELLQSGLSVSEVSSRLGFNTQNYFSQVFKRETGTSPTAYKKIAR